MFCWYRTSLLLGLHPDTASSAGVEVTRYPRVSTTFTLQNWLCEISRCRFFCRELRYFQHMSDVILYIETLFTQEKETRRCTSNTAARTNETIIYQKGWW